MRGSVVLMAMLILTTGVLMAAAQSNRLSHATLLVGAGTLGMAGLLPQPPRKG